MISSIKKHIWKMVLYICIYDIINRKTYLKTLYLIPNTFKEWAENFKSLPQYCPVMVSLWYSSPSRVARKFLQRRRFKELVHFLSDWELSWQSFPFAQFETCRSCIQGSLSSFDINLYFTSNRQARVLWANFSAQSARVREREMAHKDLGLGFWATVCFSV